jgi:uncharacterized damage-inducible protein DinB
MSSERAVTRSAAMRRKAAKKDTLKDTLLQCVAEERYAAAMRQELRQCDNAATAALRQELLHVVEKEKEWMQETSRLVSQARSWTELCRGLTLVNKLEAANKQRRLAWEAKHCGQTLDGYLCFRRRRRRAARVYANQFSLGC